MAEVTEQIVREAPEIEAYKLGLLKSAKELADQPITLPQQQIAEQSFLQQEAARLAQEGALGRFGPVAASHLRGITGMKSQAFSARLPYGVKHRHLPLRGGRCINRAICH